MASQVRQLECPADYWKRRGRRVGGKGKERKAQRRAGAYEERLETPLGEEREGRRMERMGGGRNRARQGMTK